MAERRRGFDPEGDGYDDARAKAAGMKRNAEGKMGSVAPVSESQRRRFNLPPGSYIVLKGRKHETFHKTVATERERGSEIVKHGARYYSVPKKKKPAQTPMRRLTGE